ncbi:YidB family protein [Streptomyces sp. NPDC058001]|uniref:YidB family protein n=1 Tax=Streptomyces sp. NPDC058001 TaxID=3346300 RepID=UPI0036F0E526
MAGNDIGSLLGNLLRGSSQSGSSGGSKMLGSLLQNLTKGGSSGASAGAAGGSNPLSGLMEMLNKSGLGSQAKSWVGQGDNQPVTGAQVKDALPDEALQKVADQAGVSPDHAADQIAQTLPHAVDKLTPEGQVPDGSLEDAIKRQQQL